MTIKTGLSSFRDGAAALLHKFARVAGGKAREFGQEITLAEEGLEHLGEASPETQMAVRRDAATAGIEASLAVAGALVAPEAAAVIGAIEIGEKVINTPPEKFSMKEFVFDVATSFATSVTSAFQSAAQVFFDLEAAGMEWETKHSESGKRGTPPQSPPAV